MRVVLLNDYCYVQGGASRVAIDEAVGLARLGIEVTFIGAVGPVSQELQDEGIETICLGQYGLRGEGAAADAIWRGVWNWRAYAATSVVLSALDRRDTLIHLHGFTKALSSSPVRCAVERGFSIVCTLHEYFCACPNGAFFDFPANVPCSRKPLSLECLARNCDKRHYAHKLYRVARALVQKGPGRVPTGVRSYICLSRTSRRLLEPYLPVSARIYEIENPIGGERKGPVSVEANRKIVAVGRLEREKGVEMLLEAARGTQFELSLVGDGPLRSLVPDSCSFEVTGWLPRDAVLQKLEAARCLVFPSLWFETYGLSVAEAASKGVPAIVSDVSAAAERVIDGETGWHLRTGSVTHLRELLTLIRDDGVVRAAGRAAFERFWSNPPTLDRHARELARIYEDILAAG